MKAICIVSLLFIFLFARASGQNTDFRKNYFKGERLFDTIKRVNLVQETLEKYGNPNEQNLASVAVRFALQHSAVSTVIPGIRNVSQAEMNCVMSDEPELSEILYDQLKKHNWRRAFWYSG